MIEDNPINDNPVERYGKEIMRLRALNAELLAALEQQRECPNDGFAQRQARAAIAKAKGEKITGQPSTATECDDALNKPPWKFWPHALGPTDPKAWHRLLAYAPDWVIWERAKKIKGAKTS